ncbi:hypothetical protein BD309DRAFT_955548 [Dichomitus squalens]|nr:hypothetical protein BD309DRAFT_955548 [Dichomitus squalens]
MLPQPCRRARSPSFRAQGWGLKAAWVKRGYSPPSTRRAQACPHSLRRIRYGLPSHASAT